MFKVPLSVLVVFLTACASVDKKETVVVKGRLSNFAGAKLDNAEVHFQDENFKNLVTATTDSNGEFSVDLPNRPYNSIFACKDYAKKYLEYWHWNYLPRQGDFLDIRIDGLELYGMKAWSTAPAYRGMIVFVRPMSLKKYLSLKNPQKGKAQPVSADLKATDIVATIDGNKVEVIGLNPVKEFMNKEDAMTAYTIHLSTASVNPPFRRVCLTLNDFKTSEQGMGCIDLN